MNAQPVKPRYFALIPCAGSGSRAGSAAPKQYQVLAGKRVVEHTLAAFAAVARVARTLVVLAPGDAALDRSDASFSIAHCGGRTRAASVLNGLRELKALGAGDTDWVLVHDAARCLVTALVIDRLIDACAADEVGGLLAQPLADTLKREDEGRVQETVPRDGLWLAQTPQMFRMALLVQALEQAGEAVTDEAAAIEALGLRPLLVQGAAENFKVTWPGDFALAEAVLEGRNR